jgi:hypothetical protein
MALRGHKAATAAASESAIRFLIAGCGPCVLAFPAAWVRGILTPEEAGRGQDISWAGAVYPLTNLANRLFLSPQLESTDRRVILYGNGPCLRAFVVDHVFELIDMGRAAMRPLPVQFRSDERTRLSGYLLYRKSIALIVNPLWLLETDARVDAFEPRLSISKDTEQAGSCDPAIAMSDVRISAGPVN